MAYDFKTLLIAYVISLTFVSWPIIGSYSGISGGWVGTIVLGFTGIAVAAFSFKELFVLGLPTLQGFLFLIIAGIVNGYGCYLYAVKIADHNTQTGIFIVSVSVLMVMNAPLLSWIVKGETISMRQCFGYILAIVAITLIYDKF